MNQVKPPLPPHYTSICVLCLRLIFLYSFPLQTNPRQPPSLRVPPRQPPRGKSENPKKFRRGRDSNRGPQAWEQGNFTTTLQLNLWICIRSLLLYLVLPLANEAALAARA
jgi:hypothetical protein